MTPNRPWRKILYEDQGVPDNYVDASFLDEMRKNLNTRTYDYWTVVYESGTIVQQISSVVLYALMFAYMDSDHLSPLTVLYSALAAMLGGYVMCALCWGENGNRSRKQDLRTLITYLGVAYVLSPVLMTLTESISTDTIYATTTGMMLVNLLFHDYTADEESPPGAVSLNAAIFASVCLASRLPTHLHAFTTVTTAVLVFALWPAFRNRLKRHVRGGHVTLTVLLTLSSVLVLYTVQPVLACLLALLHLFITFVCPAWLISMQPYKNTIHGPWDEAEIKED